MAITCDPAKREAALRERGLDFLDATIVFGGPHYSFVDDWQDYGEERVVTVGFPRGRLVVVGWTRRDPDRHVFSMRKADEREQARYAARLR